MAYRFDTHYNPLRINPPDEPELEAVCQSCGCYLYPGNEDPVYLTDSEIVCESCLKDRYKYNIEEVY